MTHLLRCTGSFLYKLWCFIIKVHKTGFNWIILLNVKTTNAGLYRLIKISNSFVTVNNLNQNMPILLDRLLFTYLFTLSTDRVSTFLHTMVLVWRQWYKYASMHCEENKMIPCKAFPLSLQERQHCVPLLHWQPQQ